MTIPAGARLGPYEIVGPLGAGGMGEVYEARDTRLQRRVAIKVSKKAFDDSFRQEALAIAALNHPHIATLFDVGPDYLVMEYVEGKHLRGPLPASEALRLAGQIADALEHAHKHRIVHRDLKPSNILLTRAGVKVLDFGLARRLPPRGASDESASTVSLESAFVGTPRYMAPEQIEGKGADERSDIFAFGLVFYEMLTGQRAFEGNSTAGVMASILEKAPTPIVDLKPETPAPVAQVVETCLAKDPSDRWQSVREMKHALNWAAQPGTSRPARTGRGWVKGAAAAAAFLVIGAGTVLWSRLGQPSRPQPVRLSVALPPGAFGTGGAAVSPDGKRIALVVLRPDGPPRLFVRALDALTLTAIPGAQPAESPFWSPDSRQIAFWWMGTGLHKVDPASGGPAEVVCSTCLRGGGSGVDHGATWGTTGEIVYSDTGKLFRVSAQGGEPEPLGSLVPGEIGRYWPRFLPDGRHYVYLSLASRKEDQGIYAGVLGSDLRKRIVSSEHAAAYSPPGYLVYVKEGTLVAQPFDATRLTLSGEPSPILDEEVARMTGTMAGGAAEFSVSANGVLAWRPPIRDADQLTWFDRAGRKLGTIGEPGRLFLMDLSPDEKTVAICLGAPGTKRDIWLMDVASGEGRRLTFDSHDDCGGTFSPDGKTIIFFSDRRGVRELYRKSVDGAGSEELLLASEDAGLHPEDWSADGRFLSYNAARPGRSHDLFLLELSQGQGAKPIPFVATPAMETASTLAPNGRYLAYQSNESVSEAGGWQVFVREISPSGAPGPGRWQISPRRGMSPRWRPDGKEIYFFDPPTLMAVDVEVDGPTFSAGPPRPLGINLTQTGTTSRYYVTRDGQRFLFAARAKASESIRVLVNWLPPG